MAVENVTAESWDEKVSSRATPAVVNFSADRCGFCKALDPLYSRLSEQYAGKLDFLKIMVDDPKNQSVRASIQGTPTLKFYCRGREVGEHVGYAIEPKLKEKIDTFLKEMENCLESSTPLKQTVETQSSK